MIIGCIPVGGKGTRLGLPFSKEMLPQKGFDHYKPLIAHTVDKMLEAGAEYIVFVHGKKYKEDIIDYYSSCNSIHINQKTLGFANVLLDFYKAINLKPEDKVLFGLPDSIYDGNPFIKILNYSSIVCGLFTTNDETKVDRLNTNGTLFHIKAEKDKFNQEWFWGVLKFDEIDLAQMIFDDMFSKYIEIGDILNTYQFRKIKCNSSYLDVGTWHSFNKYLSINEDDVI